MQHIVLFGGGLDSTATLFEVLKVVEDTQQITLLHIHYGQKASLKELSAATYFATKYSTQLSSLSMDLSFSKATIMSGTDIGTKHTNRLELRNLALISYASCYAASMYEHTTLYTGFHVEPKDSGFLDAKTGYLQDLQYSIDAATDRNVTLRAPLKDFTRLEILKNAHLFDPEILTYSYTCYEENVCGTCVHCVERASMIQQLEIK